jgi:hypothetical protein
VFAGGRKKQKNNVLLPPKHRGRLVKWGRVVVSKGAPYRYGTTECSLIRRKAFHGRAPGGVGAIVDDASGMVGSLAVGRCGAATSETDKATDASDVKPHWHYFDDNTLQCTRFPPHNKGARGLLCLLTPPLQLLID